MARREMDELCLQAEEAEGGIKRTEKGGKSLLFLFHAFQLLHQQLGVTDGFLLHPGQLLLVVAARIRKSPMCPCSAGALICWQR